MIAWRAFRNMLRAAARDPIWAVIAIVIGPFRAAKHVFGVLIIAMLVMLVLGLGTELLADMIGLGPKNPIRAVLGLGTIFVTLAVVFRMVTNPMINHFSDRPNATHGSARFATDVEASQLTQNTEGLLVGRDMKTGRPLRYAGPAHLLTMAPTRSGKGVGTIIPNLLTLDRSVICIDPKGENARITGRARNRFGSVHVLDPFGVTGLPPSAFNPLASLDPNGLDVAEEAATLADALVYDAPGEAGEAHWNEEAKALIAGITLYIASEEPQERRTLATLREHLTAAPDAFSALLTRMQGTAAAGGLIARAANRHRGKDNREAAGVLSAAQRHTHFLDSPRMTAVLDHSDFAFGDLKSRTATVFLVLPPDRLGTYARWLRLMVTQSLQDMARAPGKPPAPVLYLLDEFAALGHLAPIEQAMGLMAGYGVQLWPILQDVHQLRATYGQRAGTFLSNAGVLQVFGVNDHESARLVSDLLGQETVVFQTMSRALDSDKSGLSFAEHHTGRPLLTPDEVRNLPQSRELLFLAGTRPIVADKLRYYGDREFKGMFDQA
ncbi:type IV secretory system conjugative DNA transfer family protein [Xanthomonas citri]|uniref:type IV secretory system conjugative DNA transfer family protein n=1 Tax=Xanthomonas citri TaxID=346 RepID=UPI0002C3DFED|nr:type IV secretory system conjugative DNA transfer family protein [Xanthomonas citri]AGI10517.1 Type IV secretion system protein VirD4 [Xanthomonas citri subsp. citri Aw12879]AJZ42178.1 Type IV secretory pathway, VirD4 component [Xanthomonas citri pv. citri]AJZ46793.1 Type IV secretory pathway, VirD4 component [Xanthomonas citri pv. citri]AJZ51413.1 Type IV secretory pathway, VirD4 component [Xanthomonas citri pv. citri]AJZ64208.1 Type IV secretory pathway, VirD4 component [Xanthomonas citri